jgi:hypothetical protein
MGIDGDGSINDGAALRWSAESAAAVVAMKVGSLVEENWQATATDNE